MRAEPKTYGLRPRLWLLALLISNLYQVGIRGATHTRNVSTNGAGSMITDSGWLAFFDSELCIVRCGDEFGLEFNCKGALKPVL